MSKALTETSNYIPTPALALTPGQVGLICRYIDSHPPVPPAIKAALLLGFATFLRASNILSPSVSSWGGPHTLRARDILASPSRLQVIIRSTKTRRSGHPHVEEVHQSLAHHACPVTAWLVYRRTIDPCPEGPASMLNLHTPLTAFPVMTIIRRALREAGVLDVNRYSFHSLRRGAAQAAELSGTTQQEIMTHVTWRSKSAVNAYLKPSPRHVLALLAKTLAD